MKIQEFIHTATSPEIAFKKLHEEMQSFVGDYDKIISMSHSIVKKEEDNFVVTGLLCYEEG